MKEKLVKFIVDKLQANTESLRKKFSESTSEINVRHCYLDDLLPQDIAEQIANAFPNHLEMRHMKSIREDKYTSKDFDRFNPILKDMTFAIQDDSVIRIVNEITGIQEQVADSSLYAGGLSMMPENCFLNPHIDNSHDGERLHYRTLNLLFYVSKDWKPEYGGNLELWDKKVKKNLTIHSKFNRLVFMETNPWSWHSVSKVKTEKSRNCVSNYYFSKKSPLGGDYFHVTSFAARPEEKFKSILYKGDNILRQTVRFFFPMGLGKKDVYKK